MSREYLFLVRVISDRFFEVEKDVLQPSVEKNAIHLFASDSAKGMLH